ncbi:unnamed protein product [Rhizophagus irregularis]|nr:unnamed protein product [Rhizophagus irregularis]
MIENKTKYGVISTYNDHWFVKRERKILYISEAVNYHSTHPSTLKSYAYLVELAKNDTYSPAYEKKDVMIMMIMMILAQVIIPLKKAINHPPPNNHLHPPNGHLYNHIQVHKKNESNKNETWRHRDSTIEILSIIVY